MKKFLSLLLLTTLFLLIPLGFAADPVLTIAFYPIAQQQLQQNSLGILTLSENAQGVILTPQLENLPIGLHGFRYLPGNSCQNIPTHLMQPVMDPKDYPSFMPPLSVDPTGKATSAVIAPKLTLANFSKHILIIYGDPQEYPDQQFPYVAGTVIACGELP